MISLLLYTPISLLVFPFLISIYGRVANKCSCMWESERERLCVCSVFVYVCVCVCVSVCLNDKIGRKMSRKSNSNLILSLTFRMDGVCVPPSMPKVSELNSINDGTRTGTGSGSGSGSGTGTGSRPHTSSTLNNHIQN